MSPVVRIALTCAAALTAIMLAVTGDWRVNPGSGVLPLKAIFTIQTAQVQYYSSYNRYAESLQELWTAREWLGRAFGGRSNRERPGQG